MDLQLRNKTAFIAGSSHGLGFALALELAREGANVVINGRKQQDLEAAANQIQAATDANVLSFEADVADHDSALKIIRGTVDHFGGLDILVTNAGGPPAGEFESFSDDDWEKAIEFSLLSHVRLIRAALPYLRKSSTPSVLTITSYVVKQPFPHLILSNSIRAATTNLTKTLATELGTEGIRFNSILPGWTATDRITELMRHRAKANGTSIEAEMQKQVRDIPLRRFAEPEEFARAAVFLVSPAASYINGVLLPVDGGAIRGT